MTRAAVEEVLGTKRGPLLALLRRRLPSHLDPADDIATTDNEPETERCACSLALLRSLPPAYRDVLERVDIEEDALPDAARALGITRGNLSVRLLRARRALQRRLLAHCQVTTARACLSCACSG